MLRTRIYLGRLRSNYVYSHVTPLSRASIQGNVMCRLSLRFLECWFAFLSLCWLTVSGGKWVWPHCCIQSKVQWNLSQSTSLLVRWNLVCTVVTDCQSSHGSFHFLAGLGFDQRTCQRHARVTYYTQSGCRDVTRRTVLLCQIKQPNPR